MLRLLPTNIIMARVKTTIVAITSKSQSNCCLSNTCYAGSVARHFAYIVYFNSHKQPVRQTAIIIHILWMRKELRKVQ